MTSATNDRHVGWMSGRMDVIRESKDYLASNMSKVEFCRVDVLDDGPVGGSLQLYKKAQTISAMFSAFFL